ncbi:MAG: metal ABC transporter substrate-binding protein [Caldilineaceae bacterium]|nr:metal ABC transporter substrate-binding protein [Caldilineaceae bacterium]
MTVPRSIFRLLSILLVVIGSALAACAMPMEAPVAGDGPAAENQSLRIVTTSNIVADWVRRIGGEHVQVTALLLPGGDPHTFQPGPQDVARVADADLVVMVGMGLEVGWLDQLLEQARADQAIVIEMEQFIDPLPWLPMEGAGDVHGDEEMHADDEDGHGHDADADEDHADAHGHDDDADEDHADSEGHAADDHHEHGSEDPHFWFDPLRVRAAVTGLAQVMGTADPEHAATYADRAARYGLELDELHAWITEQVSMLPPEHRVLVTSHDSFQYFAQLYGFEVVGTIIPSVGTEMEVGAGMLAQLVDTIRDRGVNAIFTETTVMTDKLAAGIAQEAGVAVVVQLYTGSLGGPDSGAETYLDMMRHNVETIVQALSTQ